MYRFSTTMSFMFGRGFIAVTDTGDGEHFLIYTLMYYPFLKTINES